MDLRSKISRTGFALLRCACLSTLMIALSAPAADPKTDGLVALKQGDFENAYNLLLRAVEAAKKEKDNKETADLLFYLGLCLQEFAGRSIDLERRAQLLAEAAAYYNQALGLQPRSSSKILNNLAQIYISQGASQLAQETLLQAIALSDENQAFHLQNYADLLMAKGDWKEAYRFYTLALWAQPDNSALSKKLVDLCLKYDPTLLGAYLWDLTERGQILQAQETALAVVFRTEWRPEEKEEFLAIVAVSLSKQTYDPREFLDSSTAARLRKLSEDTAVGGGARELLRLHQPSRFRRADFPWWRVKFHPFEVSGRGKWPLQAFQDLIRSTGEYYKAKESFETAEEYLRLAVDIHEFAPDVAAFVALADLYARTGRQEELKNLIHTKQEALFGAKSRAYQRRALNEIYALHRALGSIYSLLEQWGTSSKPTSAIFQLEHALETAQEAKRNPETKPIVVEPALFDRLATGYQKTDQPVKAFKLRLDAAEGFQKAGNNEAAMEIFAPIQRTTPPRELKTRCDQIRANLESRSNSASIEKAANSKPEVRVSDKSQSIDDHRREEKLTVKEKTDIQKSLNDLFIKRRSEKNETKTIQILSPKEVPKEVKEIELEGLHGRVLLEKDAKRFEVPFTVDSNAAPKGPGTRYIQPDAPRQ